MEEIRIDLTARALCAELEVRLGTIRVDFMAAFNVDSVLPWSATRDRAAALAANLAGPDGKEVALGILEHVVPKHEAQSRDFWLSTLGRTIAYLSGAYASYSIDRRMVLEQVTGISRQGTYRIQATMRTDRYGDICADDLRAYLQKRMTRVDGA